MYLMDFIEAVLGLCYSRYIS